MKKYPETTLFVMSSLDGKISTGKINKRDFDKDFPKIKGIKEGLNQYYKIEQKTDIYSLNTGKVMKKIGVNTMKNPINCKKVTFIIIDNKNLTKKGVLNLINGIKKLYLITNNKQHPAFDISSSKKLKIIYRKNIIFKKLFSDLKNNYNINKLTIQSGGTLNALLLRNGLINHISVVIAPCLIGGKDTPTIIDGKSLISEKELSNIKSLKLRKINKLKNSYIHLIYDIK